MQEEKQDSIVAELPEGIMQYIQTGAEDYKQRLHILFADSDTFDISSSDLVCYSLFYILVFHILYESLFYPFVYYDISS